MLDSEDIEQIEMILEVVPEYADEAHSQAYVGKLYNEYKRLIKENEELKK